MSAFLEAMQILSAEFKNVSYLVLFTTGKFLFRSVMILMNALRVVFETEPYEWTGVVDHTATQLHAAFKHTGCTKLYHFLTWYRVWKLETAGEVFEHFLFFNWYTIPIWVLLYVVYFMFVFRFEDWRWRSHRTLLWYGTYVLCHVVFYFYLTFVFFCIQKDIFVSLHVIFEKSTEPLTEREYLLFLATKDDATCWEALFGKSATHTNATRGSCTC